MPKVNSINSVQDLIEADISSALLKNLVEDGEEIEREVMKIRRFYFREMNNRVISENDKPSFLFRYSSAEWRPLNDKYLKAK